VAQYKSKECSSIYRLSNEGMQLHREIPMKLRKQNEEQQCKRKINEGKYETVQEKVLSYKCLTPLLMLK
jgi:hypothetical protein